VVVVAEKQRFAATTISTAAAVEHRESRPAAEEEPPKELPRLGGPGARALEAAAARYTSMAALKVASKATVARSTAQMPTSPGIFRPHPVAAAPVTPSPVAPAAAPSVPSPNQPTPEASPPGHEADEAFKPWSLVEALGHGALAAKLAALVCGDSGVGGQGATREPSQPRTPGPGPPVSPVGDFAPWSTTAAQQTSSSLPRDSARRATPKASSPLDSSMGPSRFALLQMATGGQPAIPSALMKEAAWNGSEWQQPVGAYLPCSWCIVP
jgi:hypothetical protein